MTPENMKNPLTAPGFLCPLCGNKGKSVKRITIESLLTDEAKVGLVDMDDFTLYSLGTNFTDDGGEVFRDVKGKVKRYADQGDWVFWPIAEN